MTTEHVKLEQIVGTIAFLDDQLSNPASESDAQWIGILRTSPDEEEYRAFAKRLLGVETHAAMKQALLEADANTSIVCAGKLLKSLITALEVPLFPMGFALERHDVGAETDKSVIAAVLTDAYLHSIAKHHAGDDAAAWATTGAQLFAFLCHVTRRSVTRMNEYALCVCLLPSIAGTRQVKPEDLMAEHQAIMAFQSNHRTGAVTRVEALITYGRRIWGAVFDSLSTLQADLIGMSKAYSNARQAPQPRRRDTIMRLIERAAHPLTGSATAATAQAAQPAPPMAATVDNVRARRPTLVQRAFSKPVSKQPSQVIVTAAKQAPPPVPQRGVRAGIDYPVPPAAVMQRQSSADYHNIPPPVPATLMRDGEGPPLEVRPPLSRRSSSTGNGVLESATTKAIANSALKRRMSREQNGLPLTSSRPSSVRLDEFQGTKEASFSSVPSDLVRQASRSSSFRSQRSVNFDDTDQFPLPIGRQTSDSPSSFSSKRSNLHASSAYLVVDMANLEEEKSSPLMFQQLRMDRQTSLGDLGRNLMKQASIVDTVPASLTVSASMKSSPLPRPKADRQAKPSPLAFEETKDDDESLL